MKATDILKNGFSMKGFARFVAAGAVLVLLPRAFASGTGIEKFETPKVAPTAEHAAAYARFRADCLKAGQSADAPLLLGEATSMEKVLPRGAAAPRALRGELAVRVAGNEREAVRMRRRRSLVSLWKTHSIHYCAGKPKVAFLLCRDLPTIAQFRWDSLQLCRRTLLTDERQMWYHTQC